MPKPVAGPSRPRSNLNAPATSPPPRPAVSAFSPSRTLFALAHPVLGSADKVSAWNIIDDRLVGEWEIEGASKASSITWTTLPASAHGKKRRKRDEEAVVITTTKGEVYVWSPTKGVVNKFDLPAPATASAYSPHGVILASASAVHVLSPDNDSVTSTSLPSGTPPPTAIAILPSSSPESLHIVIASSSAMILHITSSKIVANTSPLPVSTSSTLALHTIASPQPSFLVVSDDDRTVSQYTVASPGAEPKLSYRFASPTLANAHSVSSSSTHLSVLHVSGEVSLFALPTELDLVRPKSDSRPHAVRLVEGKVEKQARVCRVCLVDDESLVAGRMPGGGRVKWVKVAVGEGEVKVRCDAQDLVSSTKESKLQRFSAPNTTDADAEIDESIELPTDVDMADVSLGERLLATSTANPSAQPNGDSDDAHVQGKDKTALPTMDGPVNAASLTRLLVQALHTSDPALLSLCLTHRDPALIRNTIRKMPTQLALPLLKACVERLGQGKGAQSRGGGRGVAQNEQQGRGTVEWVKGVLVERGAVLMTVS